jgi:hypothetical protein
MDCTMVATAPVLTVGYVGVAQAMSARAKNNAKKRITPPLKSSHSYTGRLGLQRLKQCRYRELLFDPGSFRL